MLSNSNIELIEEIEKFNPYHDARGRFASSDSATSFTYAPGKSTAHSKAIEREKEKGGAQKGFKGTLYHGSPEKNIEEFDINRAGKNTSSGEKLLYFTDSKQMADDFSYERLEGSSKYFQRRGEKGRVYEVDVEMKNPLDLRNLSDTDIDNILKLDADGILTKDMVKQLSANHQLLKASLTLTSDSLKKLGYDGLIAETGKAGHNSLEYAVVDGKQAKIRKSVAKRFDEIIEIVKFNPYHDRLGRFSSANGYASMTYQTRDPNKQHLADKFVAREKERMSKIMPTAEQTKALKAIETKTRNQKKEQYRVVDRDGNVVMQKQGDKNSVSYTVGEARDHIPGNITIHNHPDGGTFSTSDLSDIGYGATEIRAATPEGTYILRNMTKYSGVARGNQKSWYEMRDDLDAASENFKADYQLKKEVRKPFDEKLKPLIDKWTKMKEAGASKEELNKVGKEYSDMADSMSAEIKKATRAAYVDQYHRWYKSHAAEYGLEYEFIPLTSKARKSIMTDDTLEELQKSNGENILDQEIERDVEEITNDILQEIKNDFPSVEKSEKSFSVYKTSDEKRQVFGWASISITADGEQLEDRQKDMIDPEDLEEAVYEYVLNFRDTGEEHIPTMRKKGRLIESCIFTAEKQKAMGIPEGILPVGWWIGFKIDDDDAWEKVKSGVYKMFSIEGRANRVPVEKSDIGKAMTFEDILAHE